MAQLWGGHHTSGTFHPGKLACAFLHIKKIYHVFLRHRKNWECLPECWVSSNHTHNHRSKSKFRLARPLKLLPTNEVLKPPVSSAHTGWVRSALVKQVCKDLAGQGQSAARLFSTIQVQMTTTESEPHFLKAWIRRFLVDSGIEPKPLIFKALHWNIMTKWPLRAEQTHV